MSYTNADAMTSVLDDLRRRDHNGGFKLKDNQASRGGGKGGLKPSWPDPPAGYNRRCRLLPVRVGWAFRRGGTDRGDVSGSSHTAESHALCRVIGIMIHMRSYGD
ncbi:hypothetical protein BD310DRAFT_925852 [Dichomitus squalens]|uniref:Uncharacterized protein n=1 Tax=Dichomitus squalens TaxID=114155 RepID=A0A4Q9PWU1_9APHY|nr:hypothetical protein BD310DRAFT_925852 [Dichomitus squalens]